MVLVLAACVPAAVHAPEPPPAVPVRPGEPWIEPKRQVLDAVNAARRDAGLAPVAWARVLERTVDPFCARLVEESTVGYVAADGVPPYLRCVLAGGNRVHRQNVGALDSTGEVDPTDPGEISLKLLASMLGEQTADDGHRETILDPTATHLGVSDGTVRVSHEFGA